MMRSATLVLLGIALLGGCQEHKDPKAEAIDDAQAVAMVKRMNQTPFKPVIPEPLTREDLARYDLTASGCLFRPMGKAEAAPLFVAQRDRGFLKIDGVLQPVSAKSGSAELPSGAFSTYVGLDGWIELVAQAGDGIADGKGGKAWPSRLVIHDAQQRVSFNALGQVSCTAPSGD